jgi:hypothetical protein
MLQRSNEKLLNILMMMLLQKSDSEELHDEVNLGFEISSYECLVCSFLEADGLFEERS